MTDLVSLLFITMIPIDFKITNFSLQPLVCLLFLGNNYNIGELTVPLQKKE